MFSVDHTIPLKTLLIESVKINKHTGSSTCVLLKMDDKAANTLATTNLGDSGYEIYRQNSEGELK